MKYQLLIYVFVFCNYIHAQQFSEVILDPFGIDLNNAYINDMEFVDFTGDGALDIVFNDTYVGEPLLLINQGAPSLPDFTTAEIEDFTLVQIGDAWGYAQETNPNSRYIDLDLDGDLDHVFQVPGRPIDDGEFLYEINHAGVYLPDTPHLVYAFDPEKPALEIGLPNTPLDAFEIFDFVDLDGDDDKDMFAVRLYEYENKIEFVFYESLFTTTNGMFSGSAIIDPFGLDKIYKIHAWGAPAFFDVEQDGDMDLLISTATGDWAFYENIGDAKNPLFGVRQINPFGLTRIERIGNPYFIDMNNDGRKDLIVGAGDHVYYFPFNESSNTTATTPTMSANIWPNPAFDFLNVSSTELIQSYAIYNNIGETVRQSSALALHEINVSTNNLHSGSYLMRLAYANGKYENHKFIKLNNR